MRTRLSRAAAPAAVLFLAFPAVAAARGDRNDDGIPDTWERTNRLALVDGQDARDQDHDGLTNFVEWQARTNPRRADSDRDGLADGREDPDRDGLRNKAEGLTGHDPRNADTDGDGTEDGEEGAGRIVRLRRGIATIDLGDGNRVRATVDDTTALDCRTAGEWLDYRADEGDDASADDPTADDPVDDLVGDLADTTAQDDSAAADDSAPADSAPADPADDTPSADDPAADDSGCPDDAVAVGTWVHASEVDEDAGTVSWLDVVLPD